MINFFLPFFRVPWNHNKMSYVMGETIRIAQRIVGQFKVMHNDDPLC